MFLLKVIKKMYYLFSKYRNILIRILQDYSKYKRNPEKKRINFKGWDCSLDLPWVKNFYFLDFFPNEYKEREISCYKPDVEFFTVFGDREMIKKSKAPIKIFWTGEDVQNNYTFFSDYCLSDSDLSIGFNPYINEKNYMRYPYWLLYYIKPDFSKDQIANFVKKINNARYEKTEFCSLIASHNEFIRQDIYNLISQFAKINCGGKLFHNDDCLKTDYADNKTEYLKKFMFNICPENTNVDGYVTEKLFQAFESGCIPIYNGGGNYLEPGIINPKAIVYYTKENENDVLEQVKELWTNEKVYIDFISQKRLFDNSVDFIYDLNMKVRQKILEIVK